MNDAYRTVLEALERRGCDPRPTGPDSHESRCPAHDGRRHNLSVRRGDDGRVLVYCQHVDDAGRGTCSHKAIAQALGLTEADLFAPASGRADAVPGDGKGRPRKVHDTFLDAVNAALRSLNQRVGGRAEGTWRHEQDWPYQREDGAEAMRVVRFEDDAGQKQYRPIHPTEGGFVIGDPPGLLPLYRLPELRDATRVFILEGEKCVELCRELGLAGTTSSHGARSAGRTDWGPLAGKELILVPDNDEEGEGYVKAVAERVARLEPYCTVKVVRLSLPDEGDDLVQWAESRTPEEARVELERMADVAPVEVLDSQPPGPRGHIAPPGGGCTGDEGDGEGKAEGWPPLRLGSLPDVEPFPIDVLPPAAARLVAEVSGAVGIDPGMTASLLLGVAGGLIGRSACLIKGSNWFATPSLFVAAVGSPGDGKSASLEYLLSPVEAIDQELAARFAAEKEAFGQAAED